MDQVNPVPSEPPSGRHRGFHLWLGLLLAVGRPGRRQRGVGDEAVAAYLTDFERWLKMAAVGKPLRRT
jgi:hypothetical protein